MAVDNLDNDTNNKQSRRAENGYLAPIQIGQRVDNQCCNERAQLLKANSERGNLGLGRLGVAEVRLKRLVGEDAASDPGIVSS